MGAPLSAEEIARRAVALTVAETARPRAPLAVVVTRQDEFYAAAQESGPVPLLDLEADRRGSDVEASPVEATSEKASVGVGLLSPAPSSQGGQNSERGREPDTAHLFRTICNRDAAVEPQPEPMAARQRHVPDHPVITVTIAGLPGSGKSVIAHLIRNALAYEGISAEGPQQLRSVLWRRGAQDLIQRGLTVVLRAETADA